MSTIHNIHGDMAAGTSPLAATDEVAIYQAADGAAVKLTGALFGAKAMAPVATTAAAVALTLSATSHGNRTVVLNNTAPIAVTLPTATGSGTRFRIFVNQAATATASTVKVGNGTDVMQGIAMVAVATNATLLAYITSASSDSISLNGATKGGFVGDVIELSDVASGFYAVRMYANSTGTTATPFAAAVS